MQSVRLGIIEDQKLVLRLLHDICVTRYKYEVLMLAETARDGFAKAIASRPDVILIDFNLPDEDGISLGKRIGDALGSVKVIILSAENTKFLLHRVRQSGLAGYLDKDCDPDVIDQAIRAVMSGHAYFSPAIRPSGELSPTEPGPFNKVLGDRQIELLPSFGMGYSDEEIARQFQLSAATVRSHRKITLAKLGLHSTVELMRYCNEYGFVTHRPDGGSRPAVFPDRSS